MADPSAEAKSFIGSESSLEASGILTVPEEAAILSLCQQFLSCIKNKDPILMKSFLLPSGSACLVRRHRPVHLSLEAVVGRLPLDSKVEMDEQIYNCKVHVDGDLGVAWTPYVFYEDGKLHHTGTNIFNVWKTNEGWKITGVADIAREVDEKNFDPFGEAEEFKKEKHSKKEGAPGA